MRPEEVILQGTYKKEEEEYMRIKLAEYYTMYPSDKEDSQDYHSSIEERCKIIREKYNK